MAVTQKQIAEEVGLSRSMVALALSGHPRISDSTRRKVEEAAERLGYSEHSNVGARALIARRYGQAVKTGVLAALLPEAVDGVPLREMPFYVPMLRGMEIEANARGLDLILCPQRPNLPRLVEERQVDGVICIEGSSAPQQVHEVGLPCVAVDFMTDVAHSLVPSDEEGSRVATHHLLELGHRRIAFLGFDLRSAAAEKRLSGYKTALRQKKIGIKLSLIDTGVFEQNTRSGAQAMQRLLQANKAADVKPNFTKPNFSALVCHNDLLAMGAVRYLESIGLRVPEDISVVGYDDISTDYEFRPALTSIRFDRLAMGRRAIAMLCDAPHGELCHETFPVELIVRDSTSSLLKA